MSAFFGERPLASVRFGIDLLASFGELVEDVRPIVLLDLRGETFGRDELLLSVRVLLLLVLAGKFACGFSGEAVDLAERAGETGMLVGLESGDSDLCTDNVDLDALARRTDSDSSSLDEEESSLTAADNAGFLLWRGPTGCCRPRVKMEFPLPFSLLLLLLLPLPLSGLTSTSLSSDSALEPR